MDGIDTLSDIAYQQLKKKVIERHFKPGSKLDIKALSEQLGIGRMPIQDAITRLKADGLVNSRHRVGTYVVPLDKKTLENMFEAREMIEYWVTPRVIFYLRDADLEELHTILSQADKLLIGVTDKTFDYRQFVELDQQFHLKLVQICNNEHMIQMYTSLNSHLQIGKTYALQALSRSQEGQAEHKAIHEAFSERDVEKARLVQQAHINRSREGVLRLLEQQEAL